MEPDEHAGGKWRLSYRSALGRPAILEVDVNFMLRVPLWSPVRSDSFDFVGSRAVGIPVVERHELAAGKLAALLARGTSRDLFDSRRLLGSTVFDTDKLRLAFVVYGGINRVDWRTVSVDSVSTTSKEVRQRLLPMLRISARPEPDALEAWTVALVRETQDLLGAVLPLRPKEVAFLNRLNDAGDIALELLTADADLKERIRCHPGLRWKALNVRKYRGLK